MVAIVSAFVDVAFPFPPVILNHYPFHMDIKASDWRNPQGIMIYIKGRRGKQNGKHIIIALHFAVSLSIALYLADPLKIKPLDDLYVH